jgi:hypothetical protein
VTTLPERVRFSFFFYRLCHPLVAHSSHNATQWFEFPHHNGTIFFHFSILVPYLACIDTGTIFVLYWYLAWLILVPYLSCIDVTIVVLTGIHTFSTPPISDTELNGFLICWSLLCDTRTCCLSLLVGYWNVYVWGYTGLLSEPWNWVYDWFTPHWPLP